MNSYYNNAILIVKQRNSKMTAVEHFFSIDWFSSNESNDISYNVILEICKELGISSKSMNQNNHDFDYSDSEKYRHNCQIRAKVRNGKIADVKMVLNDSSVRTMSAEMIEAIGKQISFLKVVLVALLDLCANKNTPTDETAVWIKSVFHDKFGVQWNKPSVE